MTTRRYHDLVAVILLAGLSMGMPAGLPPAQGAAAPLTTNETLPPPQSTIELEWEPVADAAGYEVELAPNDGGTGLVVATTEPKITRQVRSGVYQVRIRSKDQKTGYFGAWSAKSEVEAQAHLIQAIAPVGDSVLSFPKELAVRVEFRWRSMTKAKAYVLKVWPDAQPSKFKEFKTEGTMLALRLPTGQVYHWQVVFESKTAVAYENEPQTHSFTLLGRQLLTPSLTSQSLSPVVNEITWHESPNAQSYQMKLSRRNLDETLWKTISEIREGREPRIKVRRLKPGAYRAEITAKAPHWIDSESGIREFVVKPTASELAGALATAR